MPDLFSFGTRCFRFKLIGAVKGQVGWPSNLPPNSRRFLNMKITATLDVSSLTYQSGVPLDFSGPNVTWEGVAIPGGIATQTWSYTCDRFTGNITLDPGTPYTTGAAIIGIAPFPFPYGFDYADDTNAQWTVTDSSYTKILRTTYPPLLGAAVTTIQVELTNEYTLAQLDADATQLLNAVDTDAMPWSSLVFAAYNEFQTVVGPNTPAGFLNALLPDFAEYDEVAGPGPISGESTILYNIGSDAAVAFGPIPYSAIKSAAFAVYALGYVGATAWFPNGCIKLKSVIAMAGNYCEKTFAIDDNLDDLGQTCQSGHGQCTTAFTVNPPPLNVNQNSYVLITPNCQCS